MSAREEGPGPLDLHLFNEGSHGRLHDVLGARPGPGGTRFSVWAPNAREVSVIGDFNGWGARADGLAPLGRSGIWSGWAEGACPGSRYKFRLTPSSGEAFDKADPLGLRHEAAPGTASVVWDLSYDWGDAEWSRRRAAAAGRPAPLSIYEVHLGSWRRGPGGPPGYRELAPELAAYARESGFTHVELMPVMEHPFYGSWGYQATGYFAPAARQGTPQDLMFLIDSLHRAGVGVILDWVPSHFPYDAHGLAAFDGTRLYEHSDPRQGFHPDWKSAVFNYGRHEVRSFLLSSALFWLERYHADGLRVDAVASMLYLDYSRKAGEWVPNRHGGRENLEAASFLRQLNGRIAAELPDRLVIAEESTAWPGVTRPPAEGGLGFSGKWDMGWMHDTLRYLRRDPVHRRHHHRELTFRSLYHRHEAFVLPLSHDEVVHGKGSLYEQMPGDDWQKRANLRLLFAWQWALPGGKLLFMGGELGQRREWSHERALDWELLGEEGGAGLRAWVARLNELYRALPALYEGERSPEGFEWIEADDAEHSVLTLLRRPPGEGSPAAWAFNFTPVPRPGYRIGVPRAGAWRALACSDAREFGGSGAGPGREAMLADGRPWQRRPHSLLVDLPPLGAVLLAPEAP